MLRCLLRRSSSCDHDIDCSRTQRGYIGLLVRFGELHSVQALRDKVTGLCRGYGFVKFKTAAAADRALQQMSTFELKVS